MHAIKLRGLFALLFLLIGCDQESSQAPVTSDALEQTQLLTDGFYHSAEESVLKLTEMTRTFADSVVGFLTQPDQDNLNSCREAWLLLHNSFIESDFYFYDVMRSDKFRALVFNIHAWPLEPGFIDSLPEYPTSGIVNDLAVELSKASLKRQHAATSAEEISLGLHAVEYLLWQRSLADFQPVSELLEQQVADGLVLQQLSNNRRRLALQLMSDNQKEDLEALTSLLATEREQIVNDPLTAIQQALKSSRDELTQIRSAEQQHHSEFSQSGLQNILVRIELIHKSHSKDTNLNAALQSQDQLLATEFQQTLEMILQEIKSLRLDDSDGLDRLTATISLLDHQIEAVMALLAYQMPNQISD